MNSSNLLRARKEWDAVRDGVAGHWLDPGEAEHLRMQWFNTWGDRLLGYLEKTMSDALRVQRQLQELKERYFRPVIAHPNGFLGHYGDCEVFRAILPSGPYTAPCTCGFNYLLRHLGGGLSLKLNPKYWDEYHKQEVGEFVERVTEEEQAAAWKLLVDAFGPNFKEIPADEWEDAEEEEWNQIRQAFGDDYYQFLKKEYDKLHPHGSMP